MLTTLCRIGPIRASRAAGPGHQAHAGHWAGAGLDDIAPSFLSLLKLYGNEISERRMPTRRAVEALNVMQHI